MCLGRRLGYKGCTFVIFPTFEPMQLNISHNTIMASPFAEGMLLEALKQDYPDLLSVEVDCHKPRFKDYRKVTTLDEYIDWFVSEVFVADGEFRDQSVNCLEDILVNFALHKFDPVPDYLVIKVKNWEPYFWYYPDTTPATTSLLSYFMSYFSAKTICGLADRDEENPQFAVDLLRTVQYWHARYLVILSVS